MRVGMLLFYSVFFMLGCSNDEVDPIQTSSTGDLEIYVHFEDQPYPDAQVTLTSLDKTITTDITGRVIFKNLIDGEYDIEVVLPFFTNELYNATGTVVESQKTLVDIRY